MITLRYAVETSRNIAAARTLMDNVGIENSYDYLVKMGVDGSHTTKSPSGMGLGSDGYTTLEIAGAYATLANDGVYIEPHAYTKITDLEDNEVFEKNPDSHRVFSSEAAWMMTDVLQTTMTRGYGVNARLPGITCAGKTGTHEDKVVTMAGYTHYYTCFLRISMDDDSPIKETSYANSSVLWKQMMSEMHTGLPDAPIQKKSFDDLNIVWYGGEYRHWTNNYYSKYIQPAPAEYQPTEHEVCDEYGNCWVETW
jgi:penicillin-binding protein 1A